MMFSCGTSSPVSASTLRYLIRLPVSLLSWWKLIFSRAPDFMKSLAIDHARDGDVMVAYGMNGAQLPLLNGFPLRLIVPGWYSTYWVKMLSDIEVLDQPDTNYWMATAYTIPDTP